MSFSINPETISALAPLIQNVVGGMSSGEGNGPLGLNLDIGNLLSGFGEFASSEQGQSLMSSFLSSSSDGAPEAATKPSNTLGIA